MAEREPFDPDSFLTPMQRLALVMAIVGTLALAAFGAAMLIVAVLT